jgi:DNA polymerase I-like protein with 3'-5' exonuclease and polymerase domains
MGLVRLISEDRRLYSLDSCALDYLNERKNEAELEELCKKHSLRGKPQKWLWKLIELGYGEVVAKYAKKDTRLTYDLYTKLLPEIERQGLSTIWNIEKDLVPILADTHHRGLRVDDNRREEASKFLGLEIQELKTWLTDKAGCDFNTNSPKQKKLVFDKLNLEYKTNKPTKKMLEKDPKVKGNPSFKGEDLLPFGIDPNMEYFPHVLITHNKLLKLKRDFVDRLHDFMVQGRIHSMVNPYGTKTGRPSAKTPNIFQIPKRGRGKEICRVLFLPEEGEDWASMDYASEEFRVFAHYAVGRGSDRYRANYNNEGPLKKDKYDIHIENGKLAGVDRPKAKTIGLGVMFGMGAAKMAVNLGEGEKKGLAIVKKFHEVNPSFKATSRMVSDRAKMRGYIYTLLGRRRRFPHGEGAFRGLNFLTQGNSADLAKLTIVEASKAGLLDKVNFLLWLYDEFNLSVRPENRKYVEEFKKIGENAIKFRVKMYLDLEYGPSWGEVK